MRMVMGNLLETDSDVASISDGERMCVFIYVLHFIVQYVLVENLRTLFVTILSSRKN